MKQTHHIRIHLTIHRPSPQFCDKVVAHVRQAQLRHEKQMRYIFLGVTLVSSLGAAVALVGMVRAFSTSNVGSYLSLAVSDVGMLGQYWREIGLSIAESLPVMSVVFTIGLVGVSLWSVRRLFKSTMRRSIAFAS